jgi:hypothetical protein
VVVWFIGKKLLHQWQEFRGVSFVVEPNWLIITASGVLFLATHAVLVETLRRILLAWDARDERPRLAFLTVARLWSISNFGRYVPGKVWGIGAMARMAQQAGIQGAAAAGSAVLSTIVNIGAGVLVALVAGWKSFDAISQGRTWLGFLLLGGAVAGVALLPVLLPRFLEIVRRVTGRNVAVTSMPRRAVYTALVGNLLSWLMYGAAFRLFVLGVIGIAPGSFADYVTAYAWPYILGYIVIFLPGGFGVRDLALAAALPVLGIATPQQAALISVTSRLWLTVLELLPGLVFLATGARPRTKATH